MKSQAPVIACVTAQLSCNKIIVSAKELAKKLNTDVVVITSQKKEVTAEDRARDLKILNNLSKLTDCSIDIIYSENPQLSLASYINKLEPCHVFIGNPDSSGAFFCEFMSNVVAVPVSVVNDKLIFTIPAYNREIANK